jgi:hypothetical protein
VTLKIPYTLPLKRIASVGTRQSVPDRKGILSIPLKRSPSESACIRICSFGIEVNLEIEYLAEGDQMVYRI